MKSKVKGRSSERIAENILKKLGYEIVSKNKKILLNKTVAFEVDFIIKDPTGVEYIGEVKAGKTSVSDLRQLYADSMILKMHPLMVCKGFADKAAKEVADELGVKIVTFSEYYLLLEPEELETIVQSAVKNVLEEYGLYLPPPWTTLEESTLKIVREIAENHSLEDAATQLNLDSESLGKRLGEMREKGILPRRTQNYASLKRFCQQILYQYDFLTRLDKIEKALKKMQIKRSIQS